MEHKEFQSCVSDGPHDGFDFVEETTNRKRKTSLVSSFINPKVIEKSFRLSSGSFSSFGSDGKLFPSTSLTKYRELLTNPPSPKSPLRGSSLMMELNVGVAESVGKRQKMEDRHKMFVLTKTASQEKFEQEKMEKFPHAFFGVYDGHGGTKVAEYVAERLHKAVVENPIVETNVSEALKQGFSKIEEEITAKVLNDNWDGLTGTTVCVALLDGYNLYVANVGDSGAVLCRNDGYLKLSYPHTPLNDFERQRVLQTGGVIKNDRLCHPVWNPGLINVGVTRAVGDIYYKHKQFVEDKKSGLIADPEIATVAITTSDEFLILATDGFWDVMQPGETVEYIRRQNFQGKDPTTICQELTNLSLKRATLDDVTVLLVNLQQPAEHCEMVV